MTQNKLIELSRESGFRPEMLEKVYQLTLLLNHLNLHPDLQHQWVLKGGTGLNLFYFDLPRLSVDIDINFVGAVDRQSMEERRPLIDKAIIESCQESNLEIDRTTKTHVLMKLQLKYQSLLSGRGEIQIDLNYLHRQCILPYQYQSTHLFEGFMSAKDIPILDIHEIAAGKINALLSRHKSRDLFDIAKLSDYPSFESDKLKLCTIVMFAASGKHWRDIDSENISFRYAELKNQLMPTLNQQNIVNFDQRGWQQTLLESSKKFLGRILPFTKNEKAFFDEFIQKGKIRPELITQDTFQQKAILNYPALHWEIHKNEKYEKYARNAKNEKKIISEERPIKNSYIQLSDGTTRKVIAYVESYLTYQKMIEKRFSAAGDSKEGQSFKHTMHEAKLTCQKIAKSIMNNAKSWKELSNLTQKATLQSNYKNNELAYWESLPKMVKQYKLTNPDIKFISTNIQKMAIERNGIRLSEKNVNGV